ncbi:MAG: SDR family NAD(P)-dependent oxidoreductase [Anaerolineales bacterium]|nr:SDR family NAD(P)-dependent oxidoreductase [Anaerolineales bacterium]
MGLLKKNIAFFAIDLIPLLSEQPAICRELLGELTRQLEAGALQPLPYVAFPMTQAEQAFRTMAQAKHLGKIVLVAGDEVGGEPVQIAPRPRNTVRQYGTYLITGGLGGLGLLLAGWLVERGARHIVLLGRSAPSHRALEEVASLEIRGAAVHIVQADVAVAADMRGVFDRVAAELPPLAGVFHAAGILDDGLLPDLNTDRVCRVLAPKVEGAWMLHCLTRQLDLDLFVLFSSVASVLGSPGQANYAAANAFLDGLAHYRHSQGLPALAINWGAWAEAGMAAHGRQSDHLAALGMLPFSPSFGLQLLEQVLAESDPQVAAMQADWSRLVQHFKLPLLAELATELDGEIDATQTGPGLALQAQLRILNEAERRAAIMELLQKQLANVLRTPINTIHPEQPLSELGIDSLMTVELVKPD